MTPEEMWQVVERRRRRFVGTLVAAAVLMFVGASAIGQIFGDRYGMITLLVVLIGALVFIWRDWRCPACRKGLGVEFRPRVCPHCGARLAPPES